MSREPADEWASDRVLIGFKGRYVVTKEGLIFGFRTPAAVPLLRYRLLH